jgi:Putative zinc-finger
MAEMPKIAIQRLQSGLATDQHPDSDLINALVENSLSSHERDRLLRHLTVCADCREIAVLALPTVSLPKTDASMVLAPAKAGTGWLRWPALRWAAVAACAVIVGTAVTLRYEARTGRQTGEKSDAAASFSPDSNGPLKPSATSAETSVGRVTSAGKKEAPQRAENTQKRVIPQAPSASETSALAEAAPAPATDAMLERRAKSALTTSNEALHMAANEMQTVPGRAKDALQQPPATATVGGLGAGLAKQKVAMAPAISGGFPSIFVPRWTLSSDGTLQRSVDSGRTWQTVPTPGQGNFRALAASGPEIWVGGTKGSLYHSSDAGAHWIPVLPVAGTEALASDITGIEFTDSQHGSVNTVDGESWITADAGQTWDKK